jgi:CRISPR-associated protein Cas2
MGQVLVVYDITNDRVRAKIADACQDYGLDRIQFSAFTGQLSHNHQQELTLKLRHLLGDTTGVITLVPICEKDWNNRVEVHHD